MNKVLLGLILLVPSLFAQVNTLVPSPASAYMATKPDLEKSPVPGRTLYRWSVATVLAANTADVASSWRLHEANPFVAGGGTQFGTTSIAIKSGFVATSLIIQHIALRHRPDLYKKMAWMNFVTSGVLGGVAQSNMNLR